MIRKLTLAVAFGAGYVLGAKAGQERYAQIAAGVQGLTSKPPVQRAADKAAAKAGDLADQASSAASDLADQATHKAADLAAQAKDKAAEVAQDAVATVKDAQQDDPTVAARREAGIA